MASKRIQLYGCESPVVGLPCEDWSHAVGDLVLVEKDEIDDLDPEESDGYEIRQIPHLGVVRAFRRARWPQ